MLEIGTGWGELAIRAARRGATVALGDAVERAARRWPSERIADAGFADRVDVAAQATTAHVPGHLRRDRLGGDDRGGRPRVLVDVLPDDRPPARPRRPGRRSRRSPCRTTGCWRPGAPARGSTSTSSPAGSCPRCRRSTRSPGRDTTLRVTDRLSFGQHYAETLRRWDTAFLAAATRSGRSASTRSSSGCGTSTCEYSRGGLRVGLHRRAAADPHPGGLMTTTEQRPRPTVSPSRRRAPARDALRPSSAASCPCGCAPGTAPRPVRSTRPLVELRSPDAVRRLLWHPGELGAAQAYVTGEIEVHHDLDDALTHVWSVAAERGLAGVRPRPARSRARSARPSTSARSARPPRLPASQARVRGRLHSKLRDRRGDQPPLRPVQRVLLADPRPVDGVLLGLLALRRPVVHARRRAARQARPGLPASSASSRACASSTSAAAGARCRCTPPQHYGAQVTGVTIAAEQKKFIDARIPSAASRTASRSGCRTTARSPR